MQARDLNFAEDIAIPKDPRFDWTYGSLEFSDFDCLIEMCIGEAETSVAQGETPQHE